MKKLVLVYGFLSGAVASALMLVTMPFMDRLHGSQGLVVGCTGIVLSGLLVFFGVRSYRENVGGGRITFGRGFKVGILIALIMSACYVATWQLIYYKLDPGACERVFGAELQHLKDSVAPQAEIEEAARNLETTKKILANPLTNAAMTFIEPFPVALLMTLISAAALRKTD